MNKLRKSVRQSHRSGSKVFATVEEVHMGMATVILSGPGSRITGLSVVGSPVSPGQRVMIDYSTGTPPVVRAISSLSPTITGSNLNANSGIDQGYNTPADKGMCAIRTSPDDIEIPYQTTIDVPFEGTLWDTDGFWHITDPTKFYVPLSGLYLIVAHAGFGVTEDDKGYADNAPDYAWENMPWKTFSIQIATSTGTQAKVKNHTIWDGTEKAAFFVTTHLILIANDWLKMQVSHESPSSISRWLVTDTINHIYPRMLIQFRGEV